MPGGSGRRVASAPLQYVEFGPAHPGVFAEERRDLVPLETAHDAVVAAVTGEPAGTVDPGLSGAAASLRASLDRTAVLTAGERSLLREPLDRIADGG